jgi:hypothetical protein
MLLAMTVNKQSEDHESETNTDTLNRMSPQQPYRAVSAALLKSVKVLVSSRASAGFIVRPGFIKFSDLKHRPRDPGVSINVFPLIRCEFDINASYRFLSVSEISVLNAGFHAM